MSPAPAHSGRECRCDQGCAGLSYLAVLVRSLATPMRLGQPPIGHTIRPTSAWLACAAATKRMRSRLVGTVRTLEDQRASDRITERNEQPPSISQYPGVVPGHAEACTRAATPRGAHHA